MTFKNAHHLINVSLVRMNRTQGFLPSLRIAKLSKRFHEDFVQIMLAHSLGARSTTVKATQKVPLLVERYYRTLINRSYHHIYIAYTSDPIPKLVGAVVLATLKNLPLSDGIGEIKELMVEAQYRKQGIGSKLLLKSLSEAQKMGFQTLYLRTTPQLKPLAGLLKRSGFTAVNQAYPPPRHDNQETLSQDEQNLPSYYVLRSA